MRLDLTAQLYRNSPAEPLRQWMLAEFDKGIGDLQTGRAVTLEEADARFLKFRAQWLVDHQLPID